MPIVSYSAPSILEYDKLNTILKINVIKYEPRSGTVSTQLIVLPSKDIIGHNSSITKNLVFVDYTTVNPVLRQIKAQDPFSLTEFFYYSDYVVDDSGDEFFYPFDRHYFQINYQVYEKINNKFDLYPIKYNCTLCKIEGYNFHRIDLSKEGKVILDFFIEKNIATKFIVIITNLSLLIMGILTLIMAIRILKSKKIPEISSLGFASGLLFAFPTIRNSAMPQVPPIGIFIDYLGLFPGEFCTIISVCILALCWIERDE